MDRLGVGENAVEVEEDGIEHSNQISWNLAHRTSAASDYQVAIYISRDSPNKPCSQTKKKRHCARFLNH
jgi:hypothetical protein